ncbi:MAG: hypothetical protein ABGZ17_12920 [Planctomycetaceae bacterium]
MTPRFPETCWTLGDQSSQTEETQSFELSLRDLAMETNCGTTVEEPLERILTADGKPLSMFVPDNYEPGYPYPLVIWLHGAGGSDQEIERIMPQISDRNMFGIALRGNRRSITAPQGQNSWSNDPADVAALADTLYETVCNVRRLFHIHSERIFLAGCDQGATLATRLLLEYPDWFAGLLSIGGEIPAISNPLARFRQLQGKRVLVGSCPERRNQHAKMMLLARILNSAGMQVTIRRCADARFESTTLLRDANHWLLKSFNNATLIS